jgi:phosphatidylglycerophosphatase A
MDHIIVIIATGIYSGMLPIVPGLWGALIALLFWYFCKNFELPLYIGITTCLFFIGLITAEHAERIFAQQDASPIVIDEILGIFITLTPVSKLRFGWFYGFLIFIIFDGLKPFPVSWIDTNLNGGLGIMMDDLIAGICALLFLHIVSYFLSKKKAGR